MKKERKGKREEEVKLGETVLVESRLGQDSHSIGVRGRWVGKEQVTVHHSNKDDEMIECTFAMVSQYPDEDSNRRKSGNEHNEVNSRSRSR